ncbi:MAG: TIR domain-containing protein [Chloroflexota bacterium]
MAPSGQYFFISYSRADTALQQKIVAGLRERGINAWVDIENLVPGSPAWEREIEKSIRGASGIIVLLSPDSNNSEWVRREISFAEENDKRIFPIHIRGDENDSIPLRLSSHQRVDLRRNFSTGLDNLANALKDHLGVTSVNIKINAEVRKPSKPPVTIDLKKFGLPAVLVLIGLLCIGGIATAASLLSKVNVDTPQGPTDTPPVVLDGTTPSATEPTTNYPEPTGKIIYTCSIKGDEVCIINPDGSGWQQLTDSQYAAFNASLSPDGQKAVYVISNGKYTEVLDLNLDSGNSVQLTDLGKNVGSPEISPDNKTIIFHYHSGNSYTSLWIMNRDGSNPHEFYSSPSKDVHDATWSPDGKQILFAMGKNDSNKFYIMDFGGGDPKLVNDTIDSRGRSDWSNDLISFDQGQPYLHNVFLMNTDGSDLRQVTQGNNSQGASLSPDGMWVAFTAYTADSKQNPDSCEIFIMHIDGSDIRQLTDNSYCDYQPRWGK